MLKKEVLGVVLAGMLNLTIYDMAARNYEYISKFYNQINCSLNPGKREEERKVKVTLAVDTDLVAEYEEKEIFNTLENIVTAVSERAKLEFGISFEVKDRFIYDAKKKISGYEKVDEALLKVPKLGNELRLVFTNSPLKYSKIYSEDGSAYYTPTLGMAPLNQNICLLYFNEDLRELTNTTLHEILHSFGAEHVEDKASLMYPYTNDQYKIIDSETLETVLKNKNKKFF